MGINFDRYDSFILLDMGWHIQRNRHALSGLSIDIGSERYDTGGIYGVIKHIELLKEVYPKSAILLCAEGNSWRRDIDERYKSKRKGINGYMRDSSFIYEIALLFGGVYVCGCRGFESDDVMYAWAKWLGGKYLDRQVYVYTRDKDLYQVLTDNICLVTKIHKKEMRCFDKGSYLEDENSLKDFQGCSIEGLPLYRSIVGDKSDGLPGVVGFRRKVASELCSKYTDPDSLYRYLDGGRCVEISSKQRDSLLSNEGVVRRNYRIMKLRKFSEYTDKERSGCYIIGGDGRDKRIGMLLIDVFGLRDFEYLKVGDDIGGNFTEALRIVERYWEGIIL